MAVQIAGYRTYCTVFPDLKMSFIVLANLGDFNTGEKAYAMADFFIKDTAVKKDVDKKTPRDSVAALIKAILPLQKYTGNYIGDEGCHLALISKIITLLQYLR